MIYPQKLSNKKSEKIIRVVFIFSVILGIIMFLINKKTTPNIPWSPIANAGIIYAWITVIYSIKKNSNIAAHVLVQMIIMTMLILFIDNRLGFYRLSIYIGIPIILIIANVTMLVLSIVCYKKYTKYAMYQLIIVLMSMIPIIIALNGIIEIKVLNIVAVGISLLNLTISLILSYTAIYKTLICKFHM